MNTPGIYLIIIAVVFMISGAVFLLMDKKVSSAGNSPYDDLESDSQQSSRSNRGSRQTEPRSDTMRKRLLQAGFYGDKATVWLALARLLTLIVPMLLALGITQWAGVPLLITSLIAIGVFLAGMIIPPFVLDHLKASRQKRIRRAIPDAMDILSICLEAGMSLQASLARVAEDLASAHPELALELSIVDRETHLGRRVGESMKAFADRFEIEELRSLSNAITQSERFGSSLKDALEIFSSTMRQKRTLIAETLAQKAVIALLVPTLFCILPAIFVVALGPAAITIAKSLIEP
ncbi:MAG: type II secretion system F family protein [Planctomycetes bacterium]|jgi:tight adherence protein C|nr:type II secretion system F family protein [Planctomycetota bacterium]